eukprot:TRINITY_DN8297_c0_g1_i1.p1 TRINITY_DN8297_c0_g1~~TRINITY_DN8297_c0_g1_i1.p1  ORF type:complete len:114 (-),score=11.84 TRINITY_DN8297_c0_g1_i1:1660-2001(-)
MQDAPNVDPAEDVASDFLRRDPLTWDRGELLSWASNLRTLQGKPLFASPHLDILKNAFLDGSALPILTVSDLERWGLPGGLAIQLRGAVQKLLGRSTTSVPEMTLPLVERTAC